MLGMGSVLLYRWSEKASKDNIEEKQDGMSLTDIGGQKRQQG